MKNPPEDEWLSEVHDVLPLKSKGVGFVLSCGPLPDGVNLCVGDALTFLCTDNTEVFTTIKSFFQIRHGGPRCLIFLELPKTKETEHITVGAQMFRKTLNARNAP